MNRRKTSLRRHAGMTLIEVLAALSLLGSLAVAMVLARGRLVEQHRAAEQKLKAVDAADQLLLQWWSGDSKQIPVNTSGMVEQNPGWTWETEQISDRVLTPYDAQIVRLRILESAEAGPPVELTSVDLVMPLQFAGRTP